MWILFYFVSFVSVASCLPSIEKLNVPASYYSCISDADCSLYKDACRSCGTNLIALNFQHTEAFKKIDYEARKEAKCILSCEACNTSHIKPKCLKNKCTIIN